MLSNSTIEQINNINKKAKNIKRIQLLSEKQITELYARPKFNADEQKLYFSITQKEHKVLDNYITIKAKLFFILQLGYFKAMQNFFKFYFADVVEDAKFLLQTYFGDKPIKLSGNLSRNLIASQRKEILTIFDYQAWSIKYELHIEDRICDFLRYYPKIQNTLRQLLDYFSSQKIVIPTYRKLQDLFTSAYSTEQTRLAKITLELPVSIEETLISLINSDDDGITQLMIIRADQKDFQYTAVKIEIEKASKIIDIYEFSKDFIPKLKLSKNAIGYYAELAEQYAGVQLRGINKATQLLQTICFINYRYKQIMDNLIVSFIYHIRSIIDAGKSYIVLAEIEHSSRMKIEFPKLAKFLKWFPSRNKNLNHAEVNKEAYNILPEDQFLTLATFIEGNTFDKQAKKAEFYTKSSRMLSLYLRPIIMAVPLTFYKEGSKLIELIDLIKNHYANGKSSSTFKLCDDLGLTIPSNIVPYLKVNPGDKYIDLHLLEFYVYEKIYHSLDKGKLFCNDSITYGDINNDLIDDALVDQVHVIATKFGYHKIPVYCDSWLDEMLENLGKAWENTTENIKLNRNAGFKVSENKSGGKDWSLLYDSSDKLDDAFFRTLPKVAIVDMMMYIGNLTEMWSEFVPMKDRYIRHRNTDELINACILSEAFGFGTSKMAEMSDINGKSLKTIRKNLIRIDTLCAANDVIANYICSLPIFGLWNLFDNKILADADGQKFATSNSTIQSRYSKKYLGKGKGISIYTLVANFVAVNAKNIGLNEYEGHSLYDMIFGNKTDIDIDMVTGDNHSLNKLNFIALDSINVEYVPSIKNVKEAANELLSINDPEKYAAGILKPNRKVKIDRIKTQKRGILRVLLSLIMQESTQTNIIKKINSHARYARLRAGLFEYNKIFKSIHVLNLINNMGLRKALRTARNRTEAYHQLQGLIKKIYYGIFKGKRVVDNRVSAHATRLLANCVIAYSATILNAVYEKMLKEGAAQSIIDEFARISPIAWVHILFTGRYNFKASNYNINIAGMAQILEEHLKEFFLKPT